jgi:putative glutathione S-transferase
MTNLFRLALSVVSPRMGSDGWPFASPTNEFPGATTDSVNNAQHVKDLYFKVDPNYEGR